MAKKEEANPIYDKFLTKEQVFYIERAISDGYHRRHDYPPFALVSFEDRPRFQQYIGRVLAGMIKE
jgi:hypothetical protein